MDAKGIVVVVGSCMMDFVSYAPRLPKTGETLHGTKFVTNYGGKGANQCVAAAKLGGKTALIAKVGDDVWGERYIDNLQTHHVDATHVKKAKGFHTGIAQITVSANGDNQIVIVGGANETLSAGDVNKSASTIAGAAVVVCQLETSVEVALVALKLAKGLSILNGAPAVTDYPSDLLRLPTIFCVNESEAEVFSGIQIKNKDDAKLAIKALLNRGCNSVLLTLGGDGAMYQQHDENEPLIVECPRVVCTDSTGAGDSFIGALAYLLANSTESSGGGMKKCIESACIIASDSVTRLGTQISFPSADILANL